MPTSVMHHQIPDFDRDFVLLSIFARESDDWFAIDDYGKINAVGAVHPATFLARNRPGSRAQVE